VATKVFVDLTTAVKRHGAPEDLRDPFSLLNNGTGARAFGDRHKRRQL